jgi:hypothetical protein
MVAREIRSGCTRRQTLHMMGLRGSQLVTLKIRRGPFDVRQMESEIQPGLARVREEVRPRTVRLARRGSARGRR